MINKCPNCGNTNIEGSNYCEVCGTRIKNSRIKFILMFMLFLLIIAAFSLCVTILIQNRRISNLNKEVVKLNDSIKGMTIDVSLQNGLIDKEHRKLDSLVTIVNSVTLANENDYIDLGLPSGTKWKKQNEDGEYYINTAMKQYANHLPAKEQFEELRSFCKIDWQGSGVMVTGPNGNRIFFPINKVERKNSCYGDPVLSFRNSGIYFYYRTSDMSCYPWVRIDSYGIFVGESGGWEKGTVRLVQNN